MCMATCWLSMVAGWRARAMGNSTKGHKEKTSNVSMRAQRWACEKVGRESTKNQEFSVMLNEVKHLIENQRGSGTSFSMTMALHCDADIIWRYSSTALPNPLALARGSSIGNAFHSDESVPR